MRREDLKTISDLGAYIANLEESYTNRIFHAVYANAGNLQAWYNEANKVPSTWAGRMVISPREPSAPWEQVGEIVVVGLLTRSFPD